MVELVVLGDSSGLMGVDTQRLSEHAGYAAYNLCTIGYLGVEGHRLLLESYIEKHGVPAVVVYHFAPNAMESTETETEKIGYLSRLKGALNLDDGAHRLPSRSYREIVRRRVLPEGVFDALPRGRWPSHRDTLKLLADREGSMSEIVEEDWRSPPVISGIVSPYQRRAMQRLVDLSRRRGFRLNLIVNPLPEIARTATNVAAMAALETEIAGIIEGYKNVDLYRPVSRFYPNDSCATLNHLHPDAVPENSATIADWLLNGPM
ncbi:MAG: hypothetical protein O3A00_00290 [Planctomycetota bacterium]|nr:hypothetical protein [Planctomycetota bacterium]